MKKSKERYNMKKTLLCLICASTILAGCTTGNGGSYDSDDGAYDAQTGEIISADNDYSEIDSYKPKTMAEREKASNRWNTARKETRWQEYKGTMVRIEILLGDTDVREMRLRLMQNADGMDVDADSRTIIARVADYEMKRVCGRNAESIVIVYDKPSFEVMRPTSFFDYRVESEGATMREYGFRCVYNN